MTPSHRSWTPPSAGHRFVTVGLLCLLCVSTIYSEPASADEPAGSILEFGYRDTLQDVEACLQRFVPDEAVLAELSRRVTVLGDDRFRVREQAMLALMRYPQIPPSLLAAAAVHDDPEVRFRIKRLMRARPPGYAERLLCAALQTIRDRGWRSLLSAAFAAIESSSQFSDFQLAEDTVTAVASAQDIPLLRRGLGSQSAVVRVAAIHGLARLPGNDALRDLRPRLDDPHDRVRLAAALALADSGDRAALVTLVRLLDAEQFGVRLKSVHALRYISGQRFDYSPVESDPQRAVAIAAWADWVRGPGQTAELRYPIEIPNEFELLRESSLAGWKAVIHGRAVSPAQRDQMFRVEEGVLKCPTGIQGHLRTQQRFADYRLTLEYRWPEAQFNDAGLLILLTDRDVGHGDALELQLHQGNAGDFYRIGNFRTGKLRTGVKSRLAESSEYPQGRWNRLDLTHADGNVTVLVNGVKQNEAHECPDEPRYIGLRLERYAIEFRHLLLTPLD